MKAFIIHGTYGNSDENWFPWLKEQLEKERYQVFIPKFPTPEEQSLDNWKKVLNEYPDIDNNTILIGHSLGPAFILDILEKNKAKAAFFVSGFIGLLDNEKFDVINRSFTDRNFNWEAIKENCPKFVMFHSNNDPYVPLKKAEELAQLLGIGVNVISDAGHFNKSSGYTTFPQLLETIRKV